ncbi:MAG: serine acetyltransferase [Pseudomonadota bacterium]
MALRKLLEQFVLLLSSIRLIPHLIIFKWHSNSKIIHSEVILWSAIELNYKPQNSYETLYAFVELMSQCEQFRNLFYYRMKGFNKLLSLFCSPMNTLYLDTKDIGEGLFIQHGFATMVAAKKIGINCWINQQVTIGFTSEMDYPTIGDNVTINAGAKVLGNVKIGNNVIIGANAVVVKDVPENCTVVGVPAYIIRKDGLKVNEAL